jgi:apolipoprotein N-acyltransferase
VPTKLLIVALAGLAHACSIAWPFEIGIPGLLNKGQPSGTLQILSLAAFAALLLRAPPAATHRQTAFQAAALAWAFGTAWLCGTVWWLFISMHVYGGLAAPLAVLAVFLLCGFLSLYLAVGVGFWRRFLMPNVLPPIVQSTSVATHLVAFSALWLLAELARARIFTGFPWGASGYAHADGWLAAAAPLIGVYGMGFVAALGAAALAAISLRATHLGGAAVLAAVLLLTGAAHLSKSPATAVQTLPATSLELLQGNVAQHEKFVRKGIADALDWYATRAKASTAQLVIAPETAIPLLPSDLPESYLPALREKFSTPKQSLLIGIPLINQRGYTNSVIGMNAATAQTKLEYRYDKQHLVPFGEFIPPFFKWFVRMMNIPLGDFDRGPIVQPAFAVNGQRFLPNICYEDLYGEEMAANFANAPKAPHVLVNITNIGWFGNGIANDQHLHISRLRSLEFARPMVRATNSGMTAVIDHQGVVQAELPRAKAGTLVTQVQGTEGMGGSVTPYAAWAGRFGVLPLVLFSAVILALGFAMQLRAKKHENTVGVG